MGMPKQRGEVLVTGSAYPVRRAAPACAPRVPIGAGRQDALRGRRPVLEGRRALRSAALHRDAHHLGTGLRRRGVRAEPARKGIRRPCETEHGEIHFLPNVEDPKHLVRSPGDRPSPAGFGALRLHVAAALLQGRHVRRRVAQGALPRASPRISTGASGTPRPRISRSPGTSRGTSRSPSSTCTPRRRGSRGGCPASGRAPSSPRRPTTGEAFREIPTRLDTVRLFPHAERGVLVFHGMIEVAEDDAADVAPPRRSAARTWASRRPVEHYREVLAQRLDKEKGAPARPPGPRSHAGAPGAPPIAPVGGRRRDDRPRGHGGAAREEHAAAGRDRARGGEAAHDRARAGSRASCRRSRPRSRRRTSTICPRSSSG